jgi:tetratricopeptide (TPR) repeat protein
MWGRVAAEENPASADVWNDLGFALCGLGQSKWDESIHLQEVPANEPIRTEPHGHELAPLGHDLADQALARAQAVISCQEEAVAAWEEAMDALARALEIRPDFAQAHNNCGIALLKCNRVHEARDAFVRALQIYPGYANAKANLAFAERLVQRDT